MKKQKALFLDRDGIINIDHGYVSTKEHFEFTEGIFKLLHLFEQKGYLLFIVTNQSGIGRGYYTLKAFESLTQWMLGVLEKEGITIEKVAYCPHAPNEQCTCRKPETGMIEKILKEYVVDLSCSWLMGDKQSDIDLAKKSGIAKSVSIGTKALKGEDLHFKTIVQALQYFIDHPQDF